MQNVKIHGNMQFAGVNPEIKNLELEELATDPIGPGVGRIWINTTEKAVKCVLSLTDVGDSEISILSSQAVAKLGGLVGAGIVRIDREGNWSASDLQASDVPNLDWTKIAYNRPTTLAGYGIADAASLQSVLSLQQALQDGGGMNGFVTNTDTIVDFNDATRQFTISPVGSSYRFYVKGVAYVKMTPLSVTIPNTDGMWFFFFDSTGALQASQSVWDIMVTAPISLIYWNASLGAMQFMGEERHMAIMDPATHAYLHVTEGTRYRNGFAAGAYTLTGTGAAAADAQLSIANGSIQDEDIVINITHAAVPSARFQQVLAPAAQLPVMYRKDNSWVRDTPTSYPVKKGSLRVTYNHYNTTSSLWETPDVDEGKYVAMYVVATNAITNPVVALMGQNQDSTLDNAKLNNDFAAINWGSLPFTEFKALYRLIFQTSSAYANVPKARLVAVDDLRAVKTVTISALASTAHNSLTGLTADDHQQYVHNNVPRQITAQHQFAPNVVQAPFSLNAKAQGQLVTGLNADKLDGLDASDFQRIVAAYSGSLDPMSGTTVIPYGNSEPTSQQGMPLFSKTVTPKALNSTFDIFFAGMVDVANNNRGVLVTLFRTIGTGAPVYLGMSMTWVSTSNQPQPLVLMLPDTPNTLQDVTYTAYIGASSSATWLLGMGNKASLGGANRSGWSIRESRQ